VRNRRSSRAVTMGFTAHNALASHAPRALIRDCCIYIAGRYVGHVLPLLVWLHGSQNYRGGKIVGDA